MTDSSTQELVQAERLRQKNKEKRDLVQNAEDWNLAKRERNLSFCLRIVVAVISTLMLVFLGYIVTEETLLESSERSDDVIGAVSLVAPLVGMTTITIFLLFAVFRGVKERDMTHPTVSAGRQMGSDPSP